MLDKLQQQFLKFFVREKFHGQFYFTGGTALAEVYLHHRRSFDLDFFTADQFDYERMIALMDLFAKENGLKEPQTEKKYDRRLFFFTNEQTLKVEFARFEHPQQDKRLQWDEYGILVDSLKDMASNKTLALLDRQEPKDAVDLYYLMTKTKFTPKGLLEMVKQKFGVEYKLFSFASDLLWAGKGVQELSPLLSALDKEAELGAIQSYLKEFAEKVIPFPR